MPNGHCVSVHVAVWLNGRMNWYKYRFKIQANIMRAGPTGICFVRSKSIDLVFGVACFQLGYWVKGQMGWAEVWRIPLRCVKRFTIGSSACLWHFNNIYFIQLIYNLGKIQWISMFCRYQKIHDGNIYVFLF